MKRNMEMVRRILIMIDEDEVKSRLPEEELRYHLEIMEEAGLIKNLRIQSGDYMTGGVIVESTSRIIYPGELTWKGHDLLERIRDNWNWEKIKGTIRGTGISLTLDTINEIKAKMDSKKIENNRI